MAYDKPKVTIDLEEYQNLQKEAAELRMQLAGSDISMYKKVIWAAISSGANNDFFTANCAKEGISVSLMPHTGRDVKDWERIFVNKVAKNNG